MYCEKYVEMGRKIRYYRIMQELGQGMLAEQIGITPQYLSKIEHGSARRVWTWYSASPISCR